MIIEIKKDTSSTKPVYYAINPDNDILLSGYYDIELLKSDLMILSNNDNICFITENDNCNGWSNWSTWNTYNWITCDHFTYNHFKEIENYEFFKNEIKGLLKEIPDKILFEEVNTRELWGALKE